MSAHDALQVIDAKLEMCLADPFGITSGATVAIMLTEIRDAMTVNPHWSDVEESNVRAELDRARKVAVLLEGELAQQERGQGRWPL